MARRSKDALPQEANQFIPITFSDEMREAFQVYGPAANIRAIPSVADGLKPSARRIMYCMGEEGWGPTHQRVKAAKVTGAVAGNYHPHGTSAIYGTMVGMSQDGTLNVPLITGYGNWGPVGMPPAAERYTECTLSEAAMLLLGRLEGSNELKEEAVRMVPAFDGVRHEPISLPALWPAVIINGSLGLGSGVNTTIPQFNPHEVMTLAHKLVDRKRFSAAEAAEIMPGPDFSSGCEVWADTQTIHGLYEDGVGTVRLVARKEILVEGKDTSIIITHLPHKVFPDQVVEGIQQIIQEGHLLQGAEVVNATTTDDGIRIIVRLARGENAENAWKILLHYGKKAKLITTFASNIRVNSAAMRVHSVGLIDVLRNWIDHRRECIERRSRYRRTKAQARLEVVEGFIRAIPIANLIVESIMHAADKAEQRGILIDKWSFSENQASAILDLTISQINRLGGRNYEDERDALTDLIEECTSILDDAKYRDKVLKREILEVRKIIGHDRRSPFFDGNFDIGEVDLYDNSPPAETGHIRVTRNGWVRWTKRGGKDHSPSQDNPIIASFPATEVNWLDVVTNMGYHYRTQLGGLPGNFASVKTMFPNMDPGEEPIFVDTASKFGDQYTSFVGVIQQGRIKRTGEKLFFGKNPKNAWPIVGFKEEDDYLAHGFWDPTGNAEGEELGDIMVLTAYGNAVRFSGNAVRESGMGNAGIVGVNLQAEDDFPVWAGTVTDSDTICYVTNDGRVGSFSAEEIPQKGAGTQGNRVIKLGELWLTQAFINPKFGISGKNEAEDGEIWLGYDDIPDTFGATVRKLKDPGWHSDTIVYSELVDPATD